MFTELDQVLWEDLKDIRLKTQKALDILRAIETAMKEGRLGQPDRQDSTHLTHMLVLTDLLCNEMRPWLEELGMLNLLSAAQVDALGQPIPGINGLFATVKAEATA